MNINLTLLGEFITFTILVVVTMKYVWPPIIKAMRERQKQIADGLEAAERGQKSLNLAQDRIKKQLRDIKLEAGKIIDQANQRVERMIEEAKGTADVEGKRLLELAQSDIAKEMEMAKQQLHREVVALVMQTTEKLLRKKLDKSADQQLISQFITEI